MRITIAKQNTAQTQNHHPVQPTFLHLSVSLSLFNETKGNYVCSHFLNYIQVGLPTSKTRTSDYSDAYQ